MTEIRIFQKIKHENVIKCFKFVEDCKYTTSENKSIDTYLMVLELALGGELFDLLYYTGKLDAKIARTYFKQMIAGVNAMHSKNIVHRDLKPQNLLLDKYYRLKIADFGSSGQLKSGALLDTYCGTHGFQAPEILLTKNYGPQVDMFSAGVILFIMVTGYPPFKAAKKEDGWFRCIAKGKPDSFWKKHNNALEDQLELRNTIFQLLTYQPKARMTMKELEVDKWFSGEIIEQKALVPVIAKKHKTAFKKRKEDAARSLDNCQLSVAAKRPFPGDIDPPALPPIYPLFTSFQLEGSSKPNVILDHLYVILGKKGIVEVSFSKFELTCEVKLQTKVELFGSKNEDKKTKIETVKIKIQVNGYTDEFKKFWIVFRRISGAAHKYNKFFNKLLPSILPHINADNVEVKAAERVAQMQNTDAKK